MGWTCGEEGDDEFVKGIMINKPDGGRKRGRPKRRWVDCIVRNSRSVGMNNWSIALRRDE